MVLVILLVIRTAQSVGSHLECLTQKTVRPWRLLRLQQTFNSCLNQVPMLRNTGLRETESLCIVILHMDGSLGAQEKVVILFGKALKGGINECSEWMKGTEAGVENSLQWNELLISGEK